ncbi:MsnO8 family LLM class oxidoreductase [Kibdelosporangium persicum]|uniref:Methylene-tetrahydromethanopterin reductase n=1 Tax=Kibdelosporangium persicum TaxID=2698649 RepID=A0ABX2F2V4_9PSEU|nr:MsnO8 family LLM class oxidoreductase [Kibdelosporangium persicum]NRN65637.1 Methylene-tetrahydromethanopterin reductase [Kibdelosporangium persicum]
MTPTKLSILDRSSTRVGKSDAQALRDTVRFAQQAEALGYHRFWVSEHHSVPGVAGSAPTVLAAAIAAATSAIRVGTGGVMLPNHQPLVVAEQFGVLESLYPGRIDMGLGRSVGFTDGVRRALGRDRDAGRDFGAQVKELLAYFDSGRDGVHALPAEGLRVPAFILATGEGADIAADLGLPVVVGGPKLAQAAARYRERSANPYVILAVNVAVADTTEQARRLLLPEAWSMVYSRSHGVFPPLRPVDDLDLTPRERDRLERSLQGQIYGTEDEVVAALNQLPPADELLITLSTFDRDEMLDSYSRLITAVTRAGRTAGSALARGTT